ncbi:MAG TPA: Rrf2 family transcriptional regulator [Phycisphaerae bacterium]|nr:Rrf2 family transcriptional regulator [Phycisphaerae bacterium]
MLSLSGQYALRAMIYMAQHIDDWPIPGREIADETDIPAKYLSKILGDLVRHGVLSSSRGKTGGFAMRRKPDRTRLYDILLPFEQFQHRTCPFENKRCSDAHPCLAHERWKKVVEAELNFLQKTTIAEIAV